jgi:thioredoxin 1
MNKNTGIIIGIIAAVVIAGGIYASMKSNDKAMMANEPVVQKVTEDKIMTSEKTMTKAGSYETYAPEKLARAELGDVVLFFHASWCPSCRSLGSDIENNMSSIPEKVSILKVDYDKETELRKKYGVTYQHTLVQVDKDGNLIKKWSGSPKLSSLVSEIQ